MTATVAEQLDAIQERNRTATDLYFSATELQDLMRCRRQWKYVSPTMLSLTRRGAPRIELWTGTAVHEALAAQAVGLDPRSELDKWCEDEEKRIAQDYLGMVGAPMSPVELQQLRDTGTFAKQLTKNYFDRYGWDNPIKPYEYIAPEISFRVPLPTPPEWKGPRLWLIGTFDGLALDTLSLEECIWLVEHKTYSMKPSLDTLQTDHQLRTYAWAAQVLFGKPIVGALYDGINKKLPKVPRVLQNGKGVSRALSEFDTNVATYTEAIIANGFDPADYADTLQAIYAKETADQSPFHTRWKVYFSQDDLARWGDDLTLMAMDAAECGMGTGRIYPHFSWQGCWDCSVGDLCKAEQFNEDLDFVVRTNYRVGTYGTRLAQKDLTPEDVAGITDLRELIERRRKERLEGAA